MVRNQLILGLRRRYARTLGIAETGEFVGDDLVHLAAVIRMFSPDEDLLAIRAMRPYKPNRGRWNRTALEILRKADHPLKAFEMARLVMAAQGVAPDRRTLFSIGYSLQAVLARLQARGLVVTTGKPSRASALLTEFVSTRRALDCLPSEVFRAAAEAPPADVASIAATGRGAPA